MTLVANWRLDTRGEAHCRSVVAGSSIDPIVYFALLSFDFVVLALEVDPPARPINDATSK
jgi:hypothetical protein